MKTPITIPTLLIATLIFWANENVIADDFPASMPNGVASGDVSGTSAVLWAHTTNLGTATFTYSTDPSLMSVVGATNVEVTDAALPVKVSIDGLKPGTPYYYRVTDSGSNSVVGRFRTPFDPGAFHGVRFGVSGDWRGDLAPYPSVSNAPSRHLDFFVELGDTIYADVASPAVTNARAITLAQFRAKHNEVYSNRLGLNSLAVLRGATPVFAVIDDHEIVNNFAGGAPPQSDTRFDTNGAYINETLLYRTALQVFHEYNPIRNEVYNTPDQPRTHLKPRLYRTQRYGSDAAIFLVDLRSFRDQELTDVTNPLNSSEINRFNALTFDLDPVTGKPLPHRTMLGQPQLVLLKADLLAAQADGIIWKFVLVGEPIQNLGFAAAADRYEGYAAERTELLQFITDNHIGNVVFVTADIHGTVVNNVNYQLGPNPPGIPTGTFEIVTGPIAYYKTFGPTVFDVAESIQVAPGTSFLQLLLPIVGVKDRAAFDALPRVDKDRLFRAIMDVELMAQNLDPTGLDGSDIQATLLQGSYVAVHSYGWTEFEIDAATHRLTVKTYGIDAYSPAEVGPAIVGRRPEVVSLFVVEPHFEPVVGPALTAVRLGDQIQLSWPLTTSTYVLEGANGIPLTWGDEPGAVSTNGGHYVVQVNPAGSARFFRLRQR